MSTASRIYNRKQALEKEVKELYVKGTFANSTAATAVADLTADITFTSVAAGPARNTGTITIEVAAPAANPTNTVLAVFTGTANAITVTVTPNDGTNTGAPGAAILNLTNDVTISTTTDTAARNTNTFTLQVAAAAANPTDTILAVTSGTSAATVLTITPNDGTNNAATPVNLTTAELAELIATGSVVGKTVTVTDGGSLLADLTATGGGAQNLVDAGEGDGVVGTFSGGSADAPITVTTANLVQLINTGLITGKTPTITDASSLRALQTATGGGVTPLANGGEGDGVVATFSGGNMTATMSSGYGVASVTRNGVGTWDVVLQDKYYSLKSFKGIVLKTTGEDLRMNLKSESVTSKALSFLTLTGASATDPSTGLVFFLRMDLKNGTAV